jgi:hypothetical protein
VRDEVLEISQATARRLARVRAMEAGAVAVVVAGAGCAIVQAACILTGWGPRFLPAALPLLLPPAGGVMAAVVWLRGVSSREAASVLDMRCGMDEQLGTATEVAEASDPPGPVGRFVCERALVAARGASALRQPLWTRSRATTGAMLLAVLLCGTLALVPGAGSGGRADIEAIAEAVEDMPRLRREQLAGALRLAAADDAAHAGLLNDAATAAERRDAVELAALLNELREAGIEPAEVIPASLLPSGSGGTQGTGGTGDGAPVAGANGHRPAPETAPAAPESVGVYHPEYAKTLPAAASAGTGGGEGVVEYDLAWRAAQRRAAEALARDDVPHRYRRLIRQFFAPE